MAFLDTGSPFNPLDPTFLRSRDCREIPTSPGRYVAGAVYPTEADLHAYLTPHADDRPDSELPFACPIVCTRDYSRRKVLYNRTINIPARLRDAHMAAWGPTGTSKSQKIMGPLLQSDLAEGNTICVSANLKGEEYALMSAQCCKMSIPLFYFDLSDPQKSVGFNPLSEVAEEEAYTVIASYVDLVVNRRSNDSEFWRQAGVTAMMGAWQSGCKSFAEIYDLYAGSRELAIQKLNTCKHSSAVATANFLRSGSQNADTSIATVIGWLNAFRDPAVRATTSTHEVDKATLFRHPCAIMIRCPEPLLPKLKASYNLLIQWLIDAAISASDAAPDDEARPSVSFFIEDLPAWGAIPSLIDRLATLRSRRIRVTAAIQSMAQLRFAFGDAAEAVEKAFTIKALCPGIDQADAEYFSRCSGEQQVALENDGGTVIENKVFCRNVLTASDIRCPRWQHFLLGQPLTFVMPDTTFQAYMCPMYLRPDVIAAKNCQPPLRKHRLKEPEGSPGLSSIGPFTNTTGWSDAQVRQQIDTVKAGLGWAETTGSAFRWWEAFEKANCARLPLVLRLVEELRQREATITELFLAYVYSNTDNIQGTLFVLDYSRIKKQEENGKRANNAQA